MGTITFNDQTLRYLTLFENITNTQVKDCLEFSDTLYFVVNQGQMQFAVGKNGVKIKRLRALMKKNIKIIEYSPDLERFIKNIFREFQIKNVNIENSNDGKKKVAYVSVNLRDKGKIIGRDSRNLKIAREILNRHDKIDILII
jgi:N utilization substance protein A